MAGRPSPLWEGLQGSQPSQVEGALQGLLAGRHSPGSQQQVEQIVLLAQQPATAIASPALALLARWARQQGQRGGGGATGGPAHATTTALLQRAAAAAAAALRADQLLQGPVGGPAALLLASAAAAAAGDPALRVEAAEALGGALLAGAAGGAGFTGAVQAAADATAAVGALLPALMGEPTAACWLLAALLRYLGTLHLRLPGPPLSTAAALEPLAGAYPALRAAATSALRHAAPPAAVAALLRPAYSVLRAALPLPSPGQQEYSPEPPGTLGSSLTGSVPSTHQQQLAGSAAEAAAAVLALGGLAEGLLRSAPGFPDARQLADDIEADLVAACQAADSAAAAAAQGGDGGSAAATSVGLLRDACSLSAIQLWQAVRRPLPSPVLARCWAGTLFGSALSLEPLLEQQQQLPLGGGGALTQAAAPLTRALVEQAPQLDAPTRWWLVKRVQLAAQQAHEQYRWHALRAAAGAAPPPDPAAATQLLHRLFAASMALLAAAWQGGPAAAGAAASEGHPAAAAPAEAAASVLFTLGELQFCRTAAVPQYPALLRGALGALVAAPTAGATAALLRALPCYAELAEEAPGGGAPVWVADGVAAAKVQLLLGVLAPLCGALPQEQALGQLAPLAFLYLLHPHPPTAAAAHQLLAALAAAAPAAQRGPLASYYVRRALEGVPGPTALPQLRLGLGAALRALPVGDPAALVCVGRLAARCGELAACPGQEVLAEELFGVAAQALGAVDHTQVAGAAALLEEAVAGAPPHAVPALCAAAFEAVSGVQDAVRKPALVGWFQGLAAGALAGHGGGRGSAAVAVVPPATLA